jgi:hypothetical protein
MPRTRGAQHAARLSLETRSERLPEACQIEVYTRALMKLREDIDHLCRLDNDSLLRSLKRHVGSSNRLNALVLAHLAEVDARGAYRHWACSTLAAYCVFELRLGRRGPAPLPGRARRTEFPVLFEMLADASIHLTGILLLAPYLTRENHRDVLARAR